jgi:hypothetical protein
MTAYDKFESTFLPLFDEGPPTADFDAIIARAPHFNGPEYSREEDDERLSGQIKRVYDLMVDGRWRTLQEISDSTGDPHASISAQLRHLRKKRFGSFTVDKRARGERSHGLFEYRLLPPEETP